MNRKKLLYTAAFFTLFTLVGHSMGTLLPQAPANEALAQAQSMMRATLVEMPFGAPKSLATMAYGGNVFISLYLLVSGVLLILLAKPGQFVRNISLLNAAGLAGCAGISFACFFPLPAICTGIAALLGLLASRRALDLR